METGIQCLTLRYIYKKQQLKNQTAESYKQTIDTFYLVCFLKMLSKTPQTEITCKTVLAENINEVVLKFYVCILLWLWKLIFLLHRKVKCGSLKTSAVLHHSTPLSVHLPPLIQIL